MPPEWCGAQHLTNVPQNDVRAHYILIVPNVDNTDRAKDVQGHGCHGNTAMRGLSLKKWWEIESFSTIIISV